MAKQKMQKFTVQESEIHFYSIDNEDYLSMTDIVKKFEDDTVLYNWMRNRNTIEFLGTWEQLHNPDFNAQAFDDFRMSAGLNSFTMSPKKWIEGTNAIGIMSRSGRYGGGTYAHRDIALEFCSWASPVFRLYLVKEFQHLKEQQAEQEHLTLDWNIKRMLSKINYKIHTEAIKDYLIPLRLSESKNQGIVYATEADLLNVAVFGKTAKQWHIDNPDTKGNLRDHATAEQLLVLANLENLNAEFIKLDIDREERLTMLNETAIHQMKLLVGLQVNKKLSKNTKRIGTKKS